MPHASDPQLLVLTGLRLTSYAPAERVAAVVGLDPAFVDAELARLAASGSVRRDQGAPPRWLLTPAGRADGEQRLAEELDGAGARGALVDAYDRFVELNQPFLDACTAWQLREVDGDAVPNDHTDAAHDAAAVARLGEIDDAAQPLCSRLAELLGRFSSYGGRLAEARRHVDAGEGDWFTRPFSDDFPADSYHTVWFELHEHLLASLGLDRASERGGEDAS